MLDVLYYNTQNDREAPESRDDIKMTNTLGSSLISIQIPLRESSLHIRLKQRANK
jgi:hypothetical protein